MGGGCKQWRELASDRVGQWEVSGEEVQWDSGRRVGKLEEGGRVGEGRGIGSCCDLVVSPFPPYI